MIYKRIELIRYIEKRKPNRKSDFADRRLNLNPRGRGGGGKGRAIKGLNGDAITKIYFFAAAEV